MNHVRLVIATCLLTFAVPLAAQNFTGAAKGEQKFYVKDPKQRNQAVFQSDAPLEAIIGTTSGMDGWISLDPMNVVGTIKGEIIVDATTLKTGIDLRDEHLRGEMWLNAKNHPMITFILKKLKNVKNVNATELKGAAVGDFTMRGVTREIEAQITLRYLPESEKTRTRAPGNLLAIRSVAQVNLSDFGVKNDVIGSKVADRIHFEFNAVASSVPVN